MRYENTIDLIGNTPILRLQHLPKKGAKVYVKLERYNLGGSVKDRAVLGMIRRAQEEGRIKEGGHLIEPTSGNTGIALALVGRLLGLKVTIIMPDTMSRERQDQIRAYGANLILTPGKEGMKGAIEEASQLVDKDPQAVMLQQFENPGNSQAHYDHTAQEILEDLEEIDVFVAGIGTGGTVTGVGRALKEKKKGVRIVGVEPSSSAVLQGEPAGPHGIQGIGAGFKPDVLDMDQVDEVVDVDTDLARQMTRRLALEEGLLLGISSGASVAAGLRLAEKMNPEETLLVLAPDGGEKYMSTGVFEGE